MESEDLELTVLEVCIQGGYIAPIGAWKDTVERLHAQGLLEKLDAMNYVITPKGSAEFERRENAEVMGVFREQQELVKQVIEGEATEVKTGYVSVPRGASGVTVVDGKITAVTISTIGPMGPMWNAKIVG